MRPIDYQELRISCFIKIVYSTIVTPSNTKLKSLYVCPPVATTFIPTEHSTCDFVSTWRSAGLPATVCWE